MGLRVALLSYRGDPRSGGQGVYLKRLGRELVTMGHEVTVFAGPPYPDVSRRGDGMSLVKVPSLELYVPPGPFRTRAWANIRTWPDVVEFSMMFAGRFPEPRTFTMRVARLLRGQRHRFDIVHDNQSFGAGLLTLQRAGWPVIATMHHPLTVDLQLALDHLDDPVWETSIRRWYSFIDMQREVASRLPRVLTVSQASKSDIVEHMGVPFSRVDVVPVGADPTAFRPLDDVARVPGRLITTASADVPLKGLVHLLDALARLRATRPEAHLVVIARAQPAGPVAEAIERLALHDAVAFVSDISDEALVRHYAEAQVAVVPSLYEGFSLPAVEAMACAVPLVTTTGGALPEVVGASGHAALLVPPGDAGALAHEIGVLLDDPVLACRLGANGRRRVLDRFTWQRCAEATVEHYEAVLDRAAAGSASVPVGAS